MPGSEEKTPPKMLITEPLSEPSFRSQFDHAGIVVLSSSSFFLVLN
jgi:hypothetical protein